MKNTIQKYTERLAVLKENRANTVDTNTDAENEQYDRLIEQVAEFIRDLKQCNLPVVINWAFETDKIDYSIDELNDMYESRHEHDGLPPEAWSGGFADNH